MVPVWENVGGENETPALTVEEILDKIKSKHGKKKANNLGKINPDSPGVKMVGKSKFLLPS